MLAVVLLLVGRAWIEGRRALRVADEKVERGDLVGAIAAASWAARWYAPGLPHPTRAYDRMRAIALSAEARGDADTARMAWQAIRASVHGSRGVWTPFAERATEADEHLAVLLSNLPRPGIDRNKSREELLAEHRSLLSTEFSPPPWAIGLLWTGIALVVWGLAQAANFDGSTSWMRRSGRGLLIAAAGIAIFVLAALRA